MNNIIILSDNIRYQCKKKINQVFNKYSLCIYFLFLSMHIIIFNLFKFFFMHNYFITIVLTGAC